MHAEIGPHGLHPNEYLRKCGVLYRPELPVSYHFSIVSKARKWKTNSKTWKKNWNLCLACEYDRLIGYSNMHLETWQEICRQVGIEGTFSSINKCKKAFAGIHVNIIDVLDCWNTNDVPRRFGNAHELAKYTKTTNRTLSRHIVKKDKILKILMRQIF
ncbi:hypothetical protein PENANT_c003G10601 [Penicillium antarcticum]|uniref:Uncharacterized protein n=1 Tax=Penicillium antarcticum TaxID=416450 RepID=A0A1V6QHX7_9EURO|nr:hypothetical protein PENANT_c003G10601 [Penicillium antarcticum]